ncbi:MAG TPA: hypothetical protein VI233_16245 [Puia sp.]
MKIASFFRFLSTRTLSINPKDMLPAGYNYELKKSLTYYEFNSEGPKGKIKKVVVYNFVGTWDKILHFNLGFGDYDTKTGKINDLNVSNNKDRDKILVTVANTTLKFTRHFPDCRLLMEGSTPSRTRLYQIYIAKYLAEIKKLFDIQGLVHNEYWEAFVPGHSYIAFMLIRKNNLNLP